MLSQRAQGTWRNYAVFLRTPVNSVGGAGWVAGRMQSISRNGMRSRSSAAEPAPEVGGEAHVGRVPAEPAQVDDGARVEHQRGAHGERRPEEQPHLRRPAGRP